MCRRWAANDQIGKKLRAKLLIWNWIIGARCRRTPAFRAVTDRSLAASDLSLFRLCKYGLNPFEYNWRHVRSQR